MTPLEAVREWLGTYPGHDILSNFRVDYTDQIPANGGIFPAGLVEVSRNEDVCGGVKVQNQYNFGLYYVFQKSPSDDVGAEINADWIMNFQEWVQQSTPPHFGDRTISASAQNGALYSAEAEGIATYMVQLSILFERSFNNG